MRESNGRTGAVSSAEENPFAPPQTGEKAFLGPEAMPSSAELERQRYRGPETDVRMIGWLMMLFGGLFFLMSLGTVMTLLDQAASPKIGHDRGLAVLGVVFSSLLGVAVTVPAVWGGWSLTRLRPLGRWLGGVLAALGAAVCSLVNAWTFGIFCLIVLYLLNARGAPRIFQADYREVILPATRQFNRRWNVLWRVAAAAILLAAGAYLEFSLRGR